MYRGKYFLLVSWFLRSFSNTLVSFLFDVTLPFFLKFDLGFDPFSPRISIDPSNLRLFAGRTNKIPSFWCVLVPFLICSPVGRRERSYQLNDHLSRLYSWFGLMGRGRGRGRGKKLTMVTGNEDPGSGGEEVLPTYKRRGRPQKPLKGGSDDDDDETEKIEARDNVKLTAQSKEIKGSTMVNGKKRTRYSNAKQNSDLVMDEISAGSQSIDEDSTRSNGFRHNGSRRKSKPRRAAEAGVECK